MTAITKAMAWLGNLAWRLLDGLDHVSPLSISSRQMVDEFMVRFPDRCLICSMHQYGRSHGLADPDVPLPAHQCIEAGGAMRRGDYVAG